MSVFNTCRQFIRTVPVLSRDEIDRDDVDTAAEDHVGEDSVRTTWTAPLRITRAKTRKPLICLAGNLSCRRNLRLDCKAYADFQRQHGNGHDWAKES